MTVVQSSPKKIETFFHIAQNKIVGIYLDYAKQYHRTPRSLQQTARVRLGYINRQGPQPSRSKVRLGCTSLHSKNL